MRINLKYELHNVISGKSQVRHGRIIPAIANYLDQGARTSPKTEHSKHYKEEETEKLKLFIEENNLWVDIDLNQYVSEGAEQKVYLKDSESVFKLNDTIYYASWRDYFINLLLHNFFSRILPINLLGLQKLKVLFLLWWNKPLLSLQKQQI